jgi:hypothetical protein
LEFVYLCKHLLSIIVFYLFIYLLQLLPYLLIEVEHQAEQLRLGQAALMLTRITMMMMIIVTIIMIEFLIGFWGGCGGEKRTVERAACGNPLLQHIIYNIVRRRIMYAEAQHNIVTWISQKPSKM